MKKPAVYILVLLTICSLTLTMVPIAHSQVEPTNVKVLSYSWYIDSLGLLVVVGEVQNVGSATVSSVILTGTASSSDGGQVVSNTQVYVTDLIPNQKAPFYWEFYDQSNENGGGWIHPDVTGVDIHILKADTTANYEYPDLTISNDHSSIGTNRGATPTDPSADLGVYWVTGQIKNTGSQTATNIRLIGTFYNSSGTVVAVGGYIYEVVSASLIPQNSSTFKFGAFDLNQSIVPADKKIASYSLLVQVEAPILNGTAPSIAPTTPIPGTTNTLSPSDSNSPGNTSSVSNPTGQSVPTWLYAAVAVIVIAVVAAALVTLRSRSKHKAEE